MGLTVSEELRTQVQSLEKDADAARVAAAKAGAEKDKAEADVKTHRDGMGFWDRNFWGWFGNKEKVKTYKQLKSISAEFNKKAADARAVPAQIEAKIDGEIDSYLRKSDSTYLLLQKPYNAASNFKSAAHTFVSHIDSAISAVGSAQTSEMFDLFTDSTLISVMSTLDTSSANGAINNVRRAAPDFQKAIETYNREIDSFKSESVHLNGVDDTFDMVFDMMGVGGGFDFMSALSLMALNRAESDLRELRGRVRAIENTAETHVRNAAETISSYKQQVRAACH